MTVLTAVTHTGLTSNTTTTYYKASAYQDRASSSTDTTTAVPDMEITAAAVSFK